MNPLPASKWNYATAAHLLNRAGFGGTPEEVQKLLKLGLDGAVSYFVDYEKIPDDHRPARMGQTRPPAGGLSAATPGIEPAGARGRRPTRKKPNSPASAASYSSNSSAT